MIGIRYAHATESIGERRAKGDGSPPLEDGVARIADGSGRRLEASAGVGPVGFLDGTTLPALTADGDGALIGMAMIAFGLLLFVGGLRSLVTAVSISRSEVVPVRKVPQSDGSVEFQGRARPESDRGPFEAPFSGEETLYCDVWMEIEGERRKDVDGVEILEPKEPATAKNTTTTAGLAERDEIRWPFVVQGGGARVEVDPAGATLDIGTHMGEPVLTVGAGETLSEGVRERLATLAEADVAFDCDLETWDREDESVRYREARLDPGERVHVANAAVEAVSEEWGSETDASVAAPDDGGFRIGEGTESSVVRKQAIQFVTGTVIGGGILALGFHAIGLLG